MYMKYREKFEKKGPNVAPKRIIFYRGTASLEDRGHSTYSAVPRWCIRRTVCACPGSRHALLSRCRTRLTCFIQLRTSGAQKYVPCFFCPNPCFIYPIGACEDFKINPNITVIIVGSAIRPCMPMP